MGLFDAPEKKPEGFILKSEQTVGCFYYVAVLVDKETGANYVLTGTNGEYVTFAPLVGADGKIKVDEIPENLGEKIY